MDCTDVCVPDTIRCSVPACCLHPERDLRIRQELNLLALGYRRNSRSLRHACLQCVILPTVVL